MPKLIDVTRLSPMRRGFLAGYRRARRKAKAELAHQAAEFDAELMVLRDEFHELALAHYRKCYADAIDEPERAAMSPGMLLH